MMGSIPIPSTNFFFLIMINSFEEYMWYWMAKADSTHIHWWYDYVDSKQTLTVYLRKKYKKYKDRYGKQIRAKKAKKVG